MSHQLDMGDGKNSKRNTEYIVVLNAIRWHYLKNGEIRLSRMIIAQTAVQEWMVRVMSDYIKREDAIDYLTTNINWFDADGIETSEEEKRADITELVNGVSSANVAPVRHGRWSEENIIACGGFVREYYECSICFGRNTCRSKYCPNCGARMDVNDGKEYNNWTP